MLYYMFSAVTLTSVGKNGPYMALRVIMNEMCFGNS